MLWFALFSMAMTFMFINGVDYVAWPKLNPMTDIIYYNGPGYRSAHHGKGLNPKAEPGASKQRWLRRGAGRVKVGSIEEVELGTMKKRVD